MTKEKKKPSKFNLTVGGAMDTLAPGATPEERKVVFANVARLASGVLKRKPQVAVKAAVNLVVNAFRQQRRAFMRMPGGSHFKGHYPLPWEYRRR